MCEREGQAGRQEDNECVCVNKVHSLVIEKISHPSHATVPKQIPKKNNGKCRETELNVPCEGR